MDVTRRTMVIAEAGVNHNGDLEMARRLVDAAADAGADAVKFQTFKASRLVSPDARKAAYQEATTGADETQYEMLRKLELDEKAHAELMARAKERGLTFLSTPFDEESADMLDALGVPAFKIASGELTNLPFLRHVAAKGRPMIVSTGMSTLDEVDEAVAAVRDAGDPPLTLLHCVSGYPTPSDQANLRAMETLRQAFRLPVGFSDHTTGTAVALAAAALGAAVVEKHFTLDRSLPGPDHRASLEPGDLARLVREIREVESALGDGAKRPAPCEVENVAPARRSLFAARDLAAGTTLEAPLLERKRPGDGIPPSRLDRVLGRRLSRPVRAGQKLSWEDLE